MASEAVPAVKAGGDFDKWWTRVEKQFSEPLHPGFGSQRIMNLLRLWECVYPSVEVVSFFIRELEKKDLVRVWEFAQQEYGPEPDTIIKAINATGRVKVGFGCFNSSVIEDVKTREQYWEPRYPGNKHSYGGDPDVKKPK